MPCRRISPAVSRRPAPSDWAARTPTADIRPMLATKDGAWMLMASALAASGTTPR